MKQILFRKYADITGQVLMLFPLICMAASRDDPADAIYAYFTVGAWQAISCGATAITKTTPVAASRRHYSRMLVWVVAIFAFCGLLFIGFHIPNGAERSTLAGIGDFFGGIAMLEGAIMLLLGPVMAIWYAGITVEEIRLLREAGRHRAEIHWKL